MNHSLSHRLVQTCVILQLGDERLHFLVRVSKRLKNEGKARNQASGSGCISPISRNPPAYQRRYHFEFIYRHTNRRIFLNFNHARDRLPSTHTLVDKSWHRSDIELIQTFATMRWRRLIRAKARWSPAKKRSSRISKRRSKARNLSIQAKDRSLTNRALYSWASNKRLRPNLTCLRLRLFSAILGTTLWLKQTFRASRVSKALSALKTDLGMTKPNASSRMML